LHRLLGATAEEVHQVAREFLPLDRATVLVYRPREAAPVGGGPDALRRILRETVTPAPAPPRAIHLPEDGRVAGAFTEQGVEDGVHFFELPNGVRVVVEPR